MIQRLQEWVASCSPRNLFTRISKDTDLKNKVLMFHSNIHTTSILTITAEMVTVPTTEKYILFNEDTITGIPIIFKHKGGVLRISSRYEQPHLINSLLTDLFALHYEPRVNPTVLPVDRRVSGVIYELYNFWCFNIVNTDNLSINVCTDIKNIISTIIQKQNTLYKRCNTQEVIDELRRRLSIETTISDTVRSTKSLNLRRF